MVTFSIIVKMTGLLLLAPSKSDGSLPLHVLMPFPHSGAHMAEIGYRVPKAECKGDYDDKLGICYVDMTGYYMDLGPDVLSGPASQPVQLGQTLANITTELGYTVEPTLFGNNPGSLRSRITLHSGMMLTPCGLGVWYFGRGIQLPVLLNNVVGWAIPDAGNDNLVLTRRRFGSDPTADPEKLALLLPDPATNEIELFVRQIPRGARELEYVPLNAVMTFDEMQAADITDISPPGTVARHFEGFYDLLNVNRPRPRPLPVLVLPIRSSCEWARNTATNILGRLNVYAAGTAACMVASALPPPP